MGNAVVQLSSAQTGQSGGVPFISGQAFSPQPSQNQPSLAPAWATPGCSLKPGTSPERTCEPDGRRIGRTAWGSGCHPWGSGTKRKAVSHVSDALCSLVPETAIGTLFPEVKEWVSFRRRGWVGKLQDWGLFSKCVRDSTDVATKSWQPVPWSVDKTWMHTYVVWLEQRWLFTTDEYIDKILLGKRQGQVRHRVYCRPCCCGKLMERVRGKCPPLLRHRRYAERLLNLQGL